MEFLFHEATDVHLMFPHFYVKWMGNRPGKLKSVRENPPIVQNVVFGHQCASRIVGERVPACPNLHVSQKYSDFISDLLASAKTN